MAKLILLSGSSPADEGERLVVNYLEQQLPDTYTLLPNVEITQGGRPPYEYDLIVLAPHALYAVEVKRWRGGIEGDDHTWYVGPNRVPRPNPYPTANNKARVLKSRVENYQPALGNFWVQAVVVIADDQGQLQLRGTARDWVCRYTDLDALLRNKDALPVTATDLRSFRGPLETTLRTVAQGRRMGPLRFGDYEVIETLARRDHVTEYLAQHTFLRGQERVRLRLFSYNHYLPADQLVRRRELIQREADALQQIGGHPNLIALKGFYTDPNDPNLLFSVTDWSEAGTLRDLLNNASAPLSLDRKLELAQGIAAGLRAVHAAKVIHRDVRPDNILIDRNGQPRLMNFDHARLTLPNVMTVGPVSDDPDVPRAYLAPELLNPTATPTAAADIYGLGSILFEMLVGTLLYESPEDAWRQNTSAGGPVALGASDVPERLNELVRRMIKPDPAQRPQSMEKVWEELRAVRELPSGTLQPVPASTSGPVAEITEEEPEIFAPGDIVDDKYQVQKVVAAGGFSQVYRVFDHIWDSIFALKIFKNPAGSRNHLRQEIQALRSIKHPNIAQVHNWGVLSRSRRLYMVAEFIEGEELTKFTTPDRRLPVREAVDAVIELLLALEAIHPDVDRIEELKAQTLDEERWAELGQLEEQGWLHRDIKPANLILTRQGLRLVDFNIAAKASEANRTQAGTPPYMLPEVGMMRWSPDADLFATGIVLYELITGHHPYPDRQPNSQDEPTDPLKYEANLRPEFAAILRKAVSCDAEVRYHSARRFRQDLQALDGLYLKAAGTMPGSTIALQLEPWEQNKADYNPYVTRLMTLYSQARRDNSGTRGLDDFAQQTYVKTRLDTFLQPAVLNGQYRLVIITGNAGDGKTAFIQNLEQIVNQAGGYIERPTSNSSRFVYQGIPFTTNYDGSQDEGEERANDQVLNEFFAPFIDRQIDQHVRNNSVHVIAINKGRILDFFNDSKNTTQFAQLSATLNATFDPDEEHQDLPDWLTVIDLNYRSVVARDPEFENLSIFERQLTEFLKPEFWTLCHQCALQQQCFIKHNVDTLADPVSGPAVRERLRTLFEIVHLRRKLHITMRDMRSALSWLLLRDQSCDDVAALLDSNPSPDEYLAHLYVNAFAADAPLLEGNLDDRLVRLLRQIDPAEVANPGKDRTLHFNSLEELNHLTFEGRSPLAALWLDEWKLKQGWEVMQDTEELLAHRRRHAMLRRIAYFERRDDGWQAMLPYQQLDFFRSVTQVSGRKEEAWQKLQKTLVKGVSMAEGTRDPELASRHICLRASQFNKVKVKSFRLFPSTDFKLRLPTISTPQYLEYAPDQIIFYHDPQDSSQRVEAARAAELVVSLDLLELLSQISEGFIPSLDDISGVFVNLTIFKNALAHLPYHRALLTRDDTQFYELHFKDIATVQLRRLVKE